MRIKSLACLFFAAVSVVPAVAFAGEAKVTWLNPQSYVDIASDDGPQQAFQDSLFSYLDDEFTRQAKRLPDGSVLNVTVTNFDMAGQMRQGRDGNPVREIQALWYPQMTVNYQLTDASGAIVSQQQGMVYAQQDFYNANSAMRQSQQNSTSNEFYFEDAMVRQWFYDTFFEKKK
jgi:hypothetical protein